MFSRCVALVAAVVLVALPLTVSQFTSQCIDATIQFNNMLEGNDVPAYCNTVRNRFNDQEYRIDFTQEEIEDICRIDFCLASLQEWDVYCKTYVSSVRDRTVYTLTCLDQLLLWYS